MRGAGSSGGTISVAQDVHSDEGGVDDTDAGRKKGNERQKVVGQGRRNGKRRKTNGQAQRVERGGFGAL